MFRLPKKSLVLVLFGLVLVPILLSYSFHLSSAASSGSFTFLAAGDWGYNRDTASNWASIHNSGADFVLALGDLSYASNAERNWCNDFKAQFNNVEFIVGNHDTDDSGPGDLVSYQQYCPFTLSSPIHYGVENPSGSSTSYGAEYYFDYPASAPTARFILIAPGISGHVNFDYSAGTAHYNWVSNAIDSARAAGISWVVVGMHKNCLTTGTGHTNCETGTDIQDLLLSKKVDLLLNGHEHNYERSKQLTCADNNNYLSSCVAHDGSSFVKGDGTVIVTQGVGGDSLYSVSSPLSQYFVAGEDSEFGHVKYVVSPTSITETFVSVTGSYTDGFTIGASAPAQLSASFTFSPTNPTTGTAVTFSGTVSGGTPPFAYSWNFGDGTSAAVNPASHTFTNAGTFNVVLTVTDSSSTRQTASSSKSITVTAPTSQLSASITVSPSSPTTNSLAAFTATATGGTAPYMYSWAFSDGDGGTKAGPTAYRIYDSTGSFSVTLTVTDSSSTPRQATASKTITVGSPAVVTGPTVVGWGGVRLDAAAENTANPLSQVFPNERASDMEMEAAHMYAMGFNGFRASFQSACYSPQEMGPYDPTLLSRAIEIAKHYNMWIIVDYHGYSDLVTDNSSNCWLNFWKPVVSGFKDSYSNMIWEPLNEPTGINDDVVRLSQKYQLWIDQARSLGDSHWIVAQNICSFGCGLSDFSNGFPAVNDPAGKVFISLHSYMDYGSYSNSWNNSTAESVARSFYQNVLDGVSKRGWPVLNTEGGTDPLITSCSGSVRLPSNRCAPDQILTGSAGYSTTTLDFIQTLTNLYDLDASQRINWVWWPAGGWTDTPGAGLYGALQCTSNPQGWGCLLRYQRVTSSGANSPPTLTVPQQQTANENAGLSFVVSTTDPDTGQTVTLSASSMPAVANFPVARGNPVSGTFSWTPSETQGPGDYTVTFTADDSSGGLVTKSVTVHVNEVNTPPVLAPIGNQSADEQTTLTFTVTASDEDIPTNTLAFSLGPSSPSGASISAAGVFSWTPTEAQGPGTYSVMIVVKDNGSPSLSASRTISITVNEVNLRPVVSTPGPQTVNEQTGLSFTVTASDPDVPANTLALTCTTCGSIGASFNPNTGQFTWMPTEGQGPGDYTVTFKATDNGSPPLSDSKSVVVHVNEVNQPPVLTVPGPQSVLSGTTLTVTVTAADADLPANTLTLSVDAATVPTGATFDVSTGRFTWTPAQTQTGQFIVTFKATDSGSPSLSDLKTVEIIVTAMVGQPPILTVPGDQQVNESSPLTFQVNSTDPDGRPVSLSATIMPEGASFPTLTGNPVTETFSWTPDESQGPGDYTVSFSASDGIQEVTKLVSIHVDEVNLTPEVSVSGPRTVEVLSTDNLRMKANDPDIPRNSIALSASGLATGMTFDPATGNFSFTPSPEQEGMNFDVTFAATDDGTPPLSDSKTVTIHVNSRDHGPPWQSLPYLWGVGLSSVSGILGISPFLLIGIAGIGTLTARVAVLSRRKKTYPPSGQVTLAEQ